MEGGMWRGIERRAREAVALQDPQGRARALLALLRRADEDWTWVEDPDAGWNRRVDAFTPLIDALASVGPPAVGAILAGDAPPGSWYASMAAMTLDELHGQGSAGAREDEVLDWLALNAPDQGDAYLDAAVSVVDRAGARSVPAITRFLGDTEDPLLATSIAFTFLEGSDPAWAAPAAERMLRALVDGGSGVTRTLGLVTALFALRGPAALTMIDDVMGRAVGRPREGCDRDTDEKVGAPLKAMLASAEELSGGSGEDDAIPGWMARFGPGAGPLPCAGGAQECDPDCPLADPFVDRDDLGAVPRFLLESACGELGLDAGGPKLKLVERLLDHRERGLGLLVDPVPREELEAMTLRRLRQRCEDLGLEEGGRRAELVERLDRFYRGSPQEMGEPFLPWELESMTAAQLRTVCEDMGLPAGGKKAALVARALAAQGERPGQRG